jgi:hypothetical protein
MSDITTKLQSLSRWLRQLATHEPEPECKASHVECADDCVVAADDIHSLRMKVSGKDAEIASLRDRLRDTAQILIAEVGATGPADAEEFARKAVSQIARLREALSVIAYPLNIGKVYHMDAVTQARAALAQVAEVGK